MLRTIFMIGLAAMLGLFAISFVFKILGGLLGLTMALAVVAIKVALIGGAIYLGIRILSPGTARKLRAKWDGTNVRQY